MFNKDDELIKARNAGEGQPKSQPRQWSMTTLQACSSNPKWDGPGKIREWNKYYPVGHPLHVYEPVPAEVTELRAYRGPIDFEAKKALKEREKRLADFYRSLPSHLRRPTECRGEACDGKIYYWLGELRIGALGGWSELICPCQDPWNRSDEEKNARR